MRKQQICQTSDFVWQNWEKSAHDCDSKISPNRRFISEDSESILMKVKSFEKHQKKKNIFLANVTKIRIMIVALK